jgi:hypothetical protein
MSLPNQERESNAGGIKRDYVVRKARLILVSDAD